MSRLSYKVTKDYFYPLNPVTRVKLEDNSINILYVIFGGRSEIKVYVTTVMPQPTEVVHRRVDTQMP